MLIFFNSQIKVWLQTWFIKRATTHAIDAIPIHARLSSILEIIRATMWPSNILYRPWSPVFFYAVRMSNVREFSTVKITDVFIERVQRIARIIINKRQQQYPNGIKSRHLRMTRIIKMMLMRSNNNNNNKILTDSSMKLTCYLMKKQQITV